MQTINPATHAVVDRTDLCEIKGAIEVDLDTNHVVVLVKSYEEDKRETVHLPNGVRLVRRR